VKLGRLTVELLKFLACRCFMRSLYELRNRRLCLCFYNNILKQRAPNKFRIEDVAEKLSGESHFGLYRSSMTAALYCMDLVS
jgi:hypothetical protein